MKNRISVSDLWEDYADKMLHPYLEKTSTQFIESEKIFYMAVGLTLITLKKTLGNGEVSHEDAANSMQDMLDQCTEFLKKKLL